MFFLQERNPSHVTLVGENLQDQTRRRDTPKYTPSPGPRRPPAAPPVTRGEDDDPGVTGHGQNIDIIIITIMVKRH